MGSEALSGRVHFTDNWRHRERFHFAKQNGWFASQNPVYRFRHVSRQSAARLGSGANTC